MHRVVPLFVVALCAAAETAAAQTNGFLLPCSSAGQLGRGCVTLGGVRDPATMLADPASLAGGESASLSVSAAALMPSLRYQNAANPVAVNGANNVYPLPAVFFAAPRRGRFAWGLGVQTEGGMGVDYRLTNAVLGPNQRYHSKFALLRGGLALAWQAAPKLALGASAGVLYGQMEFATPYAVNPQQLAGLAGLARDTAYAGLLAGFKEAVAGADMQGLSGTGLTASFSAEYQASSALRFALAYSVPTTLTMGGGTAAMDMNAQFARLYGGMVAAHNGDTAYVNNELTSFGINLGAGMQTSYRAAVDVGVPQTLTLSAGWRASPRLALGLDAGWVGWKAAATAFPIRLTSGSSSNVNILVNGNPASGGFTTSLPLQWKNSWTVRAGADWAAARALTLEAGGIYNTDPVASATLFTIFPAIAQSALTVGAAWNLGVTTVQFTFANTFAASQQAATPHLVGTEYAGSHDRLGERTVSVGASWRL